MMFTYLLLLTYGFDDLTTKISDNIFKLFIITPIIYYFSKQIGY